ncbi:MAG: DNA cytosine methyltransferase [Proteobacteria bacterium]|nr:DNA cytosine methyltransferase [Pseudomonadota bacterium]
MKKPLKVLDIFSGIGGFSIGLENAGMETVAFCEIEPFAQDILNKHWPHTRVFTDIRILNSDTLLKSGIAEINIIAGGFPCQDISCAGKQAGIDGNRSGLWKEFKRLIDELRPDYAIIENVANLRSRGLITVLQDLWQIGYDAQWHCIPAASVGAPHRRDRIWIVAYPNSKSNIGLPCREKTTHAMSGIGSKNISDSNSAGCNNNKGTSTEENDPKGWQECSADSISGRNIATGEGLSLHKTRPEKETKPTELQNSKTILANSDSTRTMGIGRTDNKASQKGGCKRTDGGRSRSNDRGQHNAGENEKMAYTNGQGLQGYRQFEETCQILTQEEIGLFCRSRGIEQWGTEPDTVPRLKDGRLNPDWVEWLMGFPIGWTTGGTRKQRLVALGNAVVPFIPELIGFGIAKWN